LQIQPVIAPIRVQAYYEPLYYTVQPGMSPRSASWDSHWTKGSVRHSRCSYDGQFPSAPDRVSLQDAAVASRLRVAGTVLLGKLHMNEFAIGTLYLDDDVPPARNPSSLDRMPGGEQSMPEVTFRCNTEVPEQPILPSERRLIVPETPSIGKSIMRGGNHSE